MKYAHITNGTVDDIAQVNPASIFSAAYAAQFVEAPDSVEHGWVYDGNTFSPPPTPAPTPAPIPETVTMVQARAALIIQGDFDSVQAVIDSQTGVQGQLARNAWEKGTKVSKSDALVQALKPALGWSSAKLDALFILADTL